MYGVDYCIQLEMKVECDVGMQLGTLVLSKCKCIIEYLSSIVISILCQHNFGHNRVLGII